MSCPDPGRPGPDEYAADYDQYIRLVPEGDIVVTLERQGRESRAALLAITADHASWRQALSEWNPKQVLGHLIDTERAFAYRALRIARGEPEPWSTVDLELYSTNAGYDKRLLEAIVGEFVTVRAATLAFLDGLDATAWARRSPEGWSCRSVRALAYSIAGHEISHLVDLTQFQPAKSGA
ncbi:MAG: DinB family protein [Candidatus Dormibacteraeota bacterium]|nr:DinB family protein [Candidatus Dormibacteraeota bacterium]